MAGETIKPLVNDPADLVRALNEAGWLPDEVSAAAMVRQGHSPSMVASIVGYGLISLLRPRPRGDLPRTFVLAVTQSGVTVFRARGVTHDEEDFYVTIWPEQAASWPRDLVSVERAKKGIAANATIPVQGEDPIPCADQAEPSLETVRTELGSTPPA